MMAPWPLAMRCVGSFLARVGESGWHIRLVWFDAMSAKAPSRALISLRIDLPQGRIGPGKIALLEAIDREGSISAAGRAIGMSYKRAWDLVDALNKLVGTPVVEASPGGYRGGGALLTDAGRSLVADYRAIERVAQRAAEPRLDGLMQRVGSHIVSK